MTQALAVKEMAEAAGHQIVAVSLGMSSYRQLPEYFTSAMKLPVQRLPTLELKYKNGRAVSYAATLLAAVFNLPRYLRVVRRLEEIVRAEQPDVIINFFEPVAALYALTRRRRPPVVAVGHQFMFQHPGYVKAPGLWKQLIGVRIYTWLMGARATKLALSLYEVPDLPRKRILAGPPILRRQLFRLKPNAAGDFTLVYLLNHGYAEQIMRWSDAHPETRLHCFYDKPEAPDEFAYSPALTFHKLNGEKFLTMMAECRNVVSTAGFEAVSEAFWLGKPLFLVPVENHIEQQVNAIDAQQAGLGLTAKTFDLDRLTELPEHLPTEKFHAWVDSASERFFQAVNQAVDSAQ